MTRPTWRIPNDEILLEELTEWDQSTLRERLRRLRFLRHETEGPEEGISVPSGFTGALIYGEVGGSFVAGNFIATVVLVSSFVENCLATLLERSGEKLDARVSFREVIDSAYRHAVINIRIRRTLNGLRKVRNPYVHCGEGGGLPRLLTRSRMEAGGDPRKLTEKDARQAIRALTDFIRHIEPAWIPAEQAGN